MRSGLGEAKRANGASMLSQTIRTPFRIVIGCVRGAFQESQAEQREWLERQGDRNDWEPVVVLLATALALTWRHYFFYGSELWQWIAAWLPTETGEALIDWKANPANREIARLTSWVFAQTAAFLVVPLLCCLLLKKRPADYGWKLRGATRGWQYYVGMYAIILPAILVAAQTKLFQHTYPFYGLRAGESVWPRLIVWELLYAWQFIALEFFFRGFMVHGLRKQLGFYSVLVMVTPYCMIHFGKPYPETVGSIIAGVVLGIMSLRTRSIWMGAALHIAVAWSMDLAALYVTGRLH